MPHARCTKADQMRPVMTSEAVALPNPPSDRPAGPANPAPGSAVSAQGNGAARPQENGAAAAQVNGARASLAAEARLAAELAEERHVALELQRAILPLHDEPFDLPGLRTMVRYLPASAGRVGGDWYVTADMPGGQVLIAIGDVAGHGLAATAGMARLRGALAGLAITGSPPERLVGWLNDLVRHVAPQHTASGVAGYFDPVSHMFTWAQAGHPQPVLVRGPWARPLPQPEGILLGAGRCSYAAATVQLQPGDLLLMYSDGLLERRDRPLDEGLDVLL